MQLLTLGRIIVVRLNGCFPARKSLFWCLVATILLLHGCATPAEIKTASRTQLVLIDSLDGAVKDLNSAIHRFHRDQSELIRVEGRMNIARMAVLLATEGDAEVNADELFKIFKDDIHPWIYGAYTGPIIEQRIADIEEALGDNPDFETRIKLELNRNNLRTVKANQSNKPPSLAALEGAIQDNLDNVASTVNNVSKTLKLLRVQIALMKAMQTRIEDWLAIDVSPSQDQINDLTKSIGDAHKAFSGDGS